MITARWVHRLLTDDQEDQRLKTAKKSLKRFSTYVKEKFSNVVARNKTWVYYFWFVRKVIHKIWFTKHGERPTIAKKYKEGLICKLLLSWRHCDSDAREKGKNVTGKKLQDMHLKKKEEKVLPEIPSSYHFQTCPSLYFCHCYGSFDNSFTTYLSSRPCPWWLFFCFPKSKSLLSGCRHTPRQVLKSTIIQYNNAN